MVPSAAPTVPNAGIRMTLNTIVRTVIVTPRRSGVRGSPAARNAPLSMKNIIMPKMPMNIARMNGSASACTSGAAFTLSSSVGRRNVADAGHQERERHGGEEGLVDDAIDLLGFVRAREPGDEHRHAREQRADEDDDDDDDLPADADGGVRGVADEMADHHVVDDALQPGDGVLEHRRPREPPDGGNEGPFDDRAVELLCGLQARVQPSMDTDSIDQDHRRFRARAIIAICRAARRLQSAGPDRICRPAPGPP